MIITVTHAAYDGSDFPEATHYSEYAAAQLARIYPDAEIYVYEAGYKTAVVVSGLPGDEIADHERDIRDLVATSLWDDFCSHGYKEFAP